MVSIRSEESSWLHEAFSTRRERKVINRNPKTPMKSDEAIPPTLTRPVEKREPFVSGTEGEREGRKSCTA